MKYSLLNYRGGSFDQLQQWQCHNTVNNEETPHIGDASNVAGIQQVYFLGVYRRDFVSADCTTLMIPQLCFIY